MSTLDAKLAEHPVALAEAPVAVPEKPDAAFLIALLRDDELRERVAPGFEWDYQFCHTCAMGLMQRLWGDECLGAIPAAGFFGISDWAAITIFTLQHPLTQPERIADLLEHAVERGTGCQYAPSPAAAIGCSV